jgi:hypothetical protein
MLFEGWALRFVPQGWSTQAQPVFSDTNGVTPGAVVLDPGIKRFLLTCYHTGPGQLGLFDAPEPWRPWTTVTYYEDWGTTPASPPRPRFYKLLGGHDAAHRNREAAAASQCRAQSGGKPSSDRHDQPPALRDRR